MAEKKGISEERWKDKFSGPDDMAGITITLPKKKAGKSGPVKAPARKKASDASLLAESG